MTEKQIVDYIHKNLDNESLKDATESLDNDYALSLVNQLFPIYENYRRINHDTRWNVNDSLFTGWMPQKVWEGTNVARSSLPMQIVFDQVQAAVPAIYNAIFGVGPEWFSVEAEPGSNVQEARATQATMSYFLEHAKDNLGNSALPEFNLAILSQVLYGNGGVELSWNPVLKRPIINWVDLRDFYVDPYCFSPDIDDARSLFRIKYLTVEQLKQMRKWDNFDIPDDDTLYSLSKRPVYNQGEQTKRAQEAFRGVQYTPNMTDFSPVPMERNIECLIYYSKSKIIWVLNRKVLIYNQVNPYGFYPFAFAPCFIFPSRFYAMSIGDVEEGLQRYIEALINGRLDEVSLMIRPPRVIKRGMLMTPSQQKWSPGNTYQADNPKEDLQLLTPSNNLANVYTEIQFFKTSAEERTGINSLTSAGIARPGNANRTATGMQLQAQGAQGRLQALVYNFENYCLLPILNKMFNMIQFHTNPNDELDAQTINGDFGKVPAWVYRKPMKIRMSAASRMMTKATLQQQIPFLAQYYLSGPFAQSLQSIGKTVDYSEFDQLIKDASGIANRYTLVRDLTEDEKKQQQQQQQQSQQAQQQAEQQKNQSEMQKAQLDSQTRIQVAQISKQPDPQAQQIEMLKFQLEQKKAENDMLIEQQKAMIEAKSKQQLEQIKIEAEREKNRMELDQRQKELHMKSQESAFDMQSAFQKHQLDMVMGREQMQHQSMMNQQNLENTRAMNQESLQNTQAANKQDLDYTNQKNSLANKAQSSKIKLQEQSIKKSQSIDKTKPVKTKEKRKKEV